MAEEEAYERGQVTSRGAQGGSHSLRPTYPHGHFAHIRLTPSARYLDTMTVTPSLPFDKVELCPTLGNNGKVKSSMGSSSCFDAWANPNAARYSSQSIEMVNV